ncbi:serine-rich adhesin for platelets-like [Littorina saxatilis]|uniref:serine-rich adhesin for platelets-like n=1 Tax=Littorina saxatilis TaxID=31220 RepID=UPI0038B6A331
MAVSYCETLSTNCDDDEPEDGWEDDDLFEDNSFILTATQNPQQLLGASSADSKPSERKLDTGVPVPDVSDSIIQFEECFYLSDSSSVLDSQNSAVIPPTFVPGGVKTTFRRSIVTAGLNKALCGRKNEFQRVPVKDLPSTGSAAKVTSVSNSCATVSAKLESPRSRFQLQRQKISITPKRLVQPNKAALNPADKQENPTLISDRRPPSTVESDQQRKATGPMLHTGHAQPEVQNGTQICLPPGSVSATQVKQNAHSGSKVYVPSASMSKSDAMSHQFPGNGSSSLSHAVNTILNKAASVQSHSVSSYTKFVDPQHCDEKQIEKFPGDRRNLRSASVKSKTPSQHKLSDDLSDDGLSDELLLKLTEQACAFDSQAIQEFPTQAPAKLSAPVTLTSNKPSNTHSDDFGDDLDADLLATICDFDSFSESPVLGKKMKDRLTVGVHMKNGSTNTKDGRLQRNNSLAACGSGSDVMNGGKKCSVAVNQASVSKPNTRSNSGGHNHRHWASTTTSENKSSTKSLNIPHQESTHKHLVYPPFAQEKTTRPLSSLAAGNSIFEKKSESVKKFVFKPVNASGCATSALQSGSISLHHRPDLSKQCHGKLDDGCTELDDDSDDDMMADDALYESQIIALLDEVESQATQQTASQLVDTKGPDSPLRCSQEQIEKKRQAAMQRKLRSKTRTN